jgi:hypothetical protein
VIAGRLSAPGGPEPIIDRFGFVHLSLFTPFSETFPPSAGSSAQCVTRKPIDLFDGRDAQ